MSRTHLAIAATVLALLPSGQAAAQDGGDMRDHGFYVGMGICYYGEDRPSDYFGWNTQCPLTPMPGDAHNGGTQVPPPPTPPQSNVGGGFATGAVVFAGSGVPPAGAACTATSFQLHATAEAFAVNTVITGYTGEVTIDGNGGSTCETSSNGGGTLAMSASGTGPTGSSVRCDVLTGAYTRVGVDVTATLAGSCVVNGYTARASFAFRGDFVPTGAGAGVTGPITQATFHGPFLVIPA